MKIEHFKHSLSEGSKSYYSEARIYEQFSQAEDFPGLVYHFLLPRIRRRIVLDIGCGTGKYIILFAPFAKKYYGLDVSRAQLKIARKKAKSLMMLRKVSFLNSSAEKTGLPDESVDVVLATWVFGTILDSRRRANAVSEVERVLKKKGRIYLVENDVGSEFESIRGRYPDARRTKAYALWLEKQGFVVVKKFDSYFKFNSKMQAYRVIKSIWGSKAASKAKGKMIRHKIAVYSKSK